MIGRTWRNSPHSLHPYLLPLLVVKGIPVPDFKYFKKKYTMLASGGISAVKSFEFCQLPSKGFESESTILRVISSNSTSQLRLSDHHHIIILFFPLYKNEFLGVCLALHYCCFQL